jgi:hypothetical protein
MPEDKCTPEQDPSEGSRETVERELRRSGSADNKKREQRDDRIAIPTPVEPGDQNAQTVPPSQ